MKFIFKTILGFFALWAVLLFPGTGKQKKLEKFKKWKYAHRGLHNKEKGIPENSMTAFNEAVKNGFGIELDVRLSKDGRAVIMHDESFLRVCGKKMNVSEATSADIDELYLDGTDEEVPYLEKVLKTVNGKVPLVIELKPENNKVSELCRVVFKILGNYNGLYCIESFDPRVLRWINRNYPGTVKGQLSCNFKRTDEEVSTAVHFVIKNLLLNVFTKPDFVAYRVTDKDSLSLRLCKAMFNIPEFSWTITSKEEQKKAENDGAMIIFEQFDPRG